MPSEAERDIMDPFGDKLDLLIKGKNPDKPNALFLARITWNKTRKLIWRVFDPKVADKTLKGIIANGEYPREFDYRMEHDDRWDLTRSLMSDV